MCVRCVQKTRKLIFCAQAGTTVASGRQSYCLQPTSPRSIKVQLYFWRLFGACRRQTPRARSNRRVALERARSDLSDATLRFGLALGVRRWHAPKVAKNRTRLSDTHFYQVLLRHMPARVSVRMCGGTRTSPHKQIISEQHISYGNILVMATY